MEYEVIVDPVAEADLDRIRKYDRTTIIDTIERLLSADPKNENIRAISALDPPMPTQFRLRVGDYRVYYDVDEVEKKVNIVMVREKGTHTTAEVTQS